jgi:hypothetical protein
MHQITSHAPRSEFTPNAFEQFLEGDRFQEGVLNSQHVAVRAAGVGAVLAYASYAGAVDRLDTLIGGREDEYGLPLTRRMLDKAVERVDDIKRPTLKTGVEGITVLTMTGYGLGRGLLEDAQDALSGLATKGLNNIQQ